MDCGSTLLAYYEASPDNIKIVWILSVPGFVIFMTALFLRYVLETKRIGHIKLHFER